MLSIDLVWCETKHLHFKVFLRIYMQQFGWLSERGGNFLNLLQNKGVTRKGGACHTWKCFHTALSGSVNIFKIPRCHLFMIHELSVRVNKITSRIGLSWTHSLLFCFLPIFNWWIMTILLKGCKPDNFESHNTIELSFTSIQGLCSKFVEWIFLRIKFSWHSSFM